MKKAGGEGREEKGKGREAEGKSGRTERTGEVANKRSLVEGKEGKI